MCIRDSPSEYLDHLFSLLPDLKVLYEVWLLDALPANARVAALQHSDVRAMARAADAVVLENRACADSERSAAASVAAISLACDDDAVAAQQDAVCSVQAVSAGARSSRPERRNPNLCFVHARWGKEAYRCTAPNSCKMKGVIKPRPGSSSAASGNSKAGGR